MKSNTAKDKRKVLITGTNGQLGQELVKVFEKDWVVVATDTYNLDITDKTQVGEVISREKPDVVIHCAAWTNVDAAAEKPEEAMRVNGEGTKNICEAFRLVHGLQTTDNRQRTTDSSGWSAVDRGPTLVYISTNEVFDGEKRAPYTEEDRPNPINPYGKSKLAGEEYCQEILGQNCVIVRSSWLYGPASENNFPNKIIRKAKEAGFLKVVDDEIATPTYAPDLAKAIRKLVGKKVAGIYHLVNEGQASRYEWAKQIIDEKNLKVPIEPIKLGSFARPSKPPKYSVLANTKAKEMGIVLRSWQEASKEYLSKLV